MKFIRDKRQITYLPKLHDAQQTDQSQTSFLSSLYETKQRAANMGTKLHCKIQQSCKHDCKKSRRVGPVGPIGLTGQKS